jgi:hypothetical protein
VSTLMCDDDGRTPLKLALDYPWDAEFLNVIQAATDKVLRNRQSSLFFGSTYMKGDQEEAIKAMANSMVSSVGCFLQSGIPDKIWLFKNGSDDNRTRHRPPQSRNPVYPRRLVRENGSRVGGN